MITIMVRALGAENEAKSYIGRSPFSDARGHWAEANIAYAAATKLVVGDGNGTVRPNDPINYAESLTLILRVVGKEPTTGEWPINMLLAAADYHLVPAGVTAANVREPAIRGKVFESLATAITTIKTPLGRTYLQTYVDATPPALTLTTASSSTTADKIVVEGSVDGATTITVNGTPASVVGKIFRSEVSLQYGANPITVLATDLAGNESKAEITITRTSDVSSLEIAGPAKVAPGSVTHYTITAKDANGQDIAANGLSAKVEGSIGTFSLQSGNLTAVSTPGTKGKITVTAGLLSKSIDVEIAGQDTSVTGLSIPANNGQAVAYTKPMTVTVQAVDNDGNLVANDFGRPVTLTASGMAGLTVSPAVAYTNAGVATFTVQALQPGTITLGAASAGITGAAATAVFGTTTRVHLVATPNTLSVGGAQSLARITAELRNENGDLVANTSGSPIYIRLTADAGNGVVIDDTLTIAKGMTNSTASGDDGSFSIGINAATVNIRGSLTSAQAYSVDPAQVKITVPTIGAGTKLTVFPPVNPVAPGAEGVYAVRLEDADGNLITTGTYAFQLKVDTSWAATKTNGNPEGVLVTLGDTGLVPVSDGIAEGTTNDTTDVIARTTGGVALITVVSDHPGSITLTPIPMGAYATAWSSDGVDDAAAASTSFGVENGVGLVQVTPSKIRLTANSSLGNNQEVAAMSNATSDSVTLNVTLTDGDGYWVPQWASQVSLVKVSVDNVTALPSGTTTMTSDGKASFVVKGSRTAGYDTYKVTTNIGGVITSNTVDVYVDNAKPATPSIVNVRGMNDGVPGRLDYVEASDTDMEVEFLPVATEKYVQVRLFSDKSTTTPFYTSSAFDIGSGTPRLLVPKSVIPTGTIRILADIQNGFSRSDKSAYYGNSVTNAVYNANIKITSAKYDAVGKKLNVTGQGFSSADTIDAGRITVQDASTGASRNLSGATVRVTSSSAMVLDLSDASLADLAGDLGNPTLFSGKDVVVATEVGWYKKADGTTASPDETGKPVTPSARIDRAEFDRTNKRITIIGEGFTTGSLTFSKMKLTFAGATSTQEFSLSTLGATRVDDKTLNVPLTTTAFNAIDTNGAYEVSAADGWFTDGSGTELGTSATIYAKIRPYSVSYSAGVITISGSNFGGSLDLAALSVVDESRPTADILHLSDTYVTNSTVTANTITITLNSAGQTWYETKFSGDDIYLVGDTGWLVKDGREATATAYHSLRFPRFTPPAP
jgi:3D (Asp-Asp-Asp) domain-containing protein